MSFIWNGVKQIGDEELKVLLKSRPEDVEIIDVREQHEYEAGHIPGIKWIPMWQIPEILDQFDSDREYIFVCRSGSRSMQVCKFMQLQGFDKVANFECGMLGWTGEIETGRS